MRGEWLWTETGQIFCPEFEFRSVDTFPKGSRLIPLRGFAFTLAVIGPSNDCLGWMKIDPTGFPSVRAWMDAGQPQPGV